MVVCDSGKFNIYRTGLAGANVASVAIPFITAAVQAAAEQLREILTRAIAGKHMLHNAIVAPPLFAAW
jgi:hypothetical protein